MIFQDPYASLNPRKRVGQIVGDPLRLHGLASGTAAPRRGPGAAGPGRALQPEHYNRYPHEFSGGQRQRIGIARALALRPKLIIADEPVSALDVSIQAQIINLLDDLQDEFGLTYIFVAHDLGVVRHVSDRIAVMYLGKIVERSPADELYARPIHPYTVALLSAVPIPDPKANAAREPIVLEGDVPSPVDPPPAAGSTPAARGRPRSAREEEPPLAEYGTGQAAACHHPRNVDDEQIAGAEVAPDSPESASDVLPAEAEQAAGGLLDSFLRVLALDYGTARCGCAISDPTGTLVRPLAAVEPPDPEAVAELVASEEAERVVVGLPATLAGEEGEQATLSRAFAERAHRAAGRAGRDLRRAPHHADGRPERPRGRARRPRLARGRAPARVVPGFEAGKGEG